MFESELNSFVKKFLQLKNAGANAHLDVDPRAGDAWVSLSVQLSHVPKPRRRSPSYYRRQERRRAAAEEAARQSSDKSVSDDVPAAEAVTESGEGEDQEEFSEAVTVSDSDMPSSARNWIHGINEIEKGKYWEYSISNLEAIIIDTVASVESVDYSEYRHGRSRYIKCRHCKKSMIEENFVIHRCYTKDQGFQDDVIARVEPGAKEVRSILCL